jgi:hypothetical protein
MDKQHTSLQFHPVTPDRWKDFEKLFGSNGACAGCWCMWWRLSRSEFSRKQYAANKRAIKKIIMAGQKPGILAYADGKPIGWCAMAPREAYSSLERSNVLKRVDDSPVWREDRRRVSDRFRRRKEKYRVGFYRPGLHIYRCRLCRGGAEIANASHHALFPQMKSGRTSVHNDCRLNVQFFCVETRGYPNDFQRGVPSARILTLSRSKPSSNNCSAAPALLASSAQSQ